MSQTLRVTALVAVTFLCAPSPVSAQTNPCALLTSAEAVKHIARGQPTYNQAPEAVALVGGAVCDYPFGGQIGLWTPPNAEQSLESFLKSWKVTAKRFPVAGVGDKAWIMFPPPENEYKDRPAYLVAHVGPKVVTVALFARKGAADGPMGEVCRGDQGRLKPDEKKDCVKILADKSETQESLQPNVVELARLVVQKVRGAK